MVLFWMLVALAVLDVEHFWLPDWITWTGIAAGILARFLFIIPLMHINDLTYWVLPEFDPLNALGVFLSPLLAALIAAGLILLIRWIYWLIRRREGLGLGDAKLMAMLAAWLGLPGALLSFGLGVVLGAISALVLLVLPSTHKSSEGWAHIKLPLGTFLCVGGIVSSLWGEQMIHAYLRWAGF
jgi:leader peptidase (prepilin peptidase)/N-methyltransferase